MIIIPAIDILDGKCVRLYKGDYATKEVVAQDPVETAKAFINEGATHIHIVDLNGARQDETGKKRQNFGVISKICKFGANVDVGGGIRSIEHIEEALDAGADKVVLGSAALKNPEFLAESLKKYGEKIIVGIDAQNGFVKTEGWIEESNTHYLDFARKVVTMGAKNIIFTDISKDGTLSGVNFDEVKAINEAANNISPCNVIASGGIRDMEDIKALKKLGIYGAICGKSIYTKTLNLKEAIEYCKNNRKE